MANRYWVGGNGTWDASDTTHWASSSGGAGGQSVPSASDNVFFDTNSGPATVTLNTNPTVTFLQFSNLGSATNATTFNAGAFTLIATSYFYFGDYHTFNMSSSTWKPTPSATLNFFTISANAVINAETSTILVQPIGGGEHRFQSSGVSKTLNNITVDGVNSGGTSTISFVLGNYTINTFSVINPPIGIRFYEGNTLTFSNITANGTVGNLITFDTFTPGSFVTISANSTSLSYVDAMDIHATGAAVNFDDTVGGVDSGGNMFWCFPTGCVTLPTYNPSIITSVKRVLQNLPTPQFIIAGQGTGSLYQLFKKSTTYAFNVWRSPVYQIGKNFDVMEILLPIHPDMTTNMSIIPVLYFDNEDSNSVGTTLNSTNYPDSDRLIRLTSKNFSNTVHGRNNFFLELQFTGSALSVVELPISIDLEVQEL